MKQPVVGLEGPGEGGGGGEGVHEARHGEGGLPLPPVHQALGGPAHGGV